MEARRAAVRAQLAALSERDLRLFVEILAIDVEAVELPLAQFLATDGWRQELPDGWRQELPGETAEPTVGDWMAVANRDRLLSELFGGGQEPGQ
jgi:hypothetical protein